MQSGIDVDVLVSEDGLMIKEIIYGRLGLSRGLLRRMKSGGGVFLNDLPAYITQRVKVGDKLRIEFADSNTNLEPEQISLSILYEDEFLLVINKPPHLAVYPTRSYPTNTLANALAYHWQQQNLKRKVRLLHRLDRDTSGAIIVAKEPYSYQVLAQQLRTRQLRRIYLAIVAGSLDKRDGIINQPIGRSINEDDHALKRVVSVDGKEAITKYRVLQEFQGFSLVQLELLTGRTHQIRVHLDWLGHPIIGDNMYYCQSNFIDRQALHAWLVAFVHPHSGKKLEIEAPLPKDMLQLIKHRGNNYYSNQ